jgi:hypothetical protein
MRRALNRIVSSVGIRALAGMTVRRLDRPRRRPLCRSLVYPIATPTAMTFA